MKNRQVKGSCPERIDHERFVLRCRVESDARLVKQAIDDNLEHLRRFMPWAWNEPQPLETSVTRIREARRKFLQAEEWQFGIFTRDETRFLGSIGLHRMDASDGMEIGYWLCEEATGQGIATEATRILTNLALESLAASRVEIHCDVENSRSGEVPRRLGFTLEATRREIFEGKPRVGQVWVRTRPIEQVAG